MVDSSLEGFRDRASLRRALAHHLCELQPDLRILAEGYLAEISTIDLLAVGGEGELVSIRFSKPEDDRATLTRALADLTWLRPRRADLLKLSPGAGIDPSIEPRALVVCHGFSAETLAAVDNFPDHTVALWRCRGRLDDAHPMLEMEPVGGKGAPPAPREMLPARPVAGSSPRATGATSTGRNLAAAASPARRPLSPGPLADPPSPSAFRSGLADADLASLGGPESERFSALDAHVDERFST